MNKKKLTSKREELLKSLKETLYPELPELKDIGMVSFYAYQEDFGWTKIVGSLHVHFTPVKGIDPIHTVLQTAQSIKQDSGIDIESIKTYIVKMLLSRTEEIITKEEFVIYNADGEEIRIKIKDFGFGRCR